MFRVTRYKLGYGAYNLDSHCLEDGILAGAIFKAFHDELPLPKFSLLDRG